MRCNRASHIGDAELSPCEFDRYSRCRACHAQGARRAHLKRRGVPIDPPPGFVSIKVAAATLGITVHTLNRRIAVGRYEGHTWKRGPLDMWYIREEALGAR